MSAPLAASRSARLDRRVAHPARSRAAPSRRRRAARSAPRLGFADRLASARRGLRPSKPVDALAQRRRCARPAPRSRCPASPALVGERVELAARAGQRAEEMIGALVAVASASSAKRWSISARPRSISASIRCDARSCSATCADRPSSDAPALADVRAERVGRFDAGPADAGRGLVDQRRDRRRLDVDARRGFRRASAAVRSSSASSAPEKLRFGLVDPRRGGRAGAFDLGQMGDQPLRCRADHLVGLASALGQRARPAGRSRRLRAADSLPIAAQLLGDRARASLRRAAGRRAARRCRCAPLRRRGRAPRRARVSRSMLASSSRVMPPSLPVVSSPRPISWSAIAAQRALAVVDPLRQHLEQRLERLRLGAHRDDRAGEALGFLAAGAAEHQPDQAEQGQRPGGDRHPLRDRRRRSAAAPASARPADQAV